MHTRAIRLPSPARCASSIILVPSYSNLALTWRLVVFRGLRRGGCSPRQQRRFIAAPAKPVKVPSAAHVAHPSMTHRVAQDETLWDLAMRYGVTMKSIRAVNGIPEDTYVIIPGQVLVLPIQSLDKKAPASWVEDTSSLKDPSLASKNWLWTGKDAAVKHTSTVELANLLDPPEGTNPLNHDTVVVAYMPDCKHCQDLEPVIDQLSKGLKHEPSLQFLALRCHSQDANIFAKDVLGARSFPTIVTYTHDGSLYRLRPKGNTVKGILAFINDTVRMDGDAPFELLAPEAVLQSTAPNTPPLPPVPAATGVAVATVVAGAACFLLHKRGAFNSVWENLKQRVQGPATQSQEDASAMALDAASGHLTGTENAVPSAQQVESVASDIDSTHVPHDTPVPDNSDPQDEALELSGSPAATEEQSENPQSMLGSLGAKMKSFLNAGSAEDTAQRDSQQKDTTGKDTTGKDSLQKQPSAAASPQVATSTQQQPSVADSAPDPSVESAQGPEVHKVVEQPNAFAHDSDEPADDQSEINNRTVVGTSTAVASGILKTMDISSGGRESNKPARNSVDPSALKTVDISYSGAHTDADVPTGPLDTVDLSSNSARSKESAPEGFPVPLNEHANPPGHDPQQAAVAAATGAVAASAAPIGVASVDRTGSAVDLSSSGSASDDQSPANPSDAERTVDVTGRGPRPSLQRSTDEEVHLGRDVPRPRMVRMSVHEAPDWDKIDDDQVLDAWTVSGGDVLKMAAILSGTDGTDGSAAGDAAGAPKDMRGALKALKRALKRSTQESTDELAMLASKRE